MTDNPKPPRRWRWARRLIVLAGLGIALYLAFPWLLHGMGQYLDVSEPPRRADCVLVLGGSPSSRPFVAAALVRAGLVRRALVPTCKLSPEAQDGLVPPEHELIRRVLLARGARPENVVLLPGECDSTVDEANALARFLDEEPEATVAIVTDGYHTRRARMLFRRALGANHNRVYFVAASVDYVDADHWWRTEKGFVLYLNEYCKLLLYTFRKH
jgi:uncharacterized SAM-binding protein YcdF (DUF218 family)